jgi:pSer/pThr/pTyr-binding forkhead associated (FHA) protein
MIVEMGDKELERRLNLYQVFLKLYEHHSSLLNEILQLENLDHLSLPSLGQSYIQGVLDTDSVYLITNLCENKTQSLRQPQQIWIIGRDYSSGIQIDDKYLSRRHAAIQYIEDQGFYLIDFKSKNGSSVNGEPVYQPVKLEDGDHIRLGSVVFDFYLSYSSRILPTVAMELLMQLATRTDSNTAELQSNLRYLQKLRTENPNVNVSPDSESTKKSGKRYGGFTTEQQSEILDRFFSRQKSSNSV